MKSGDHEAVVYQLLDVPRQRAVVVAVAAEGLDPPGLMAEVAGDLPVPLPAGSLVGDSRAEEGRVRW